VKEELFKHICVLLLLLSIDLKASDLEYESYIFSDFIPYQESKTSFGINFFKDSDIKTSFVCHNWFSKNLYVDGSLQSLKKNNSININYKISLAYAYTFNNKFLKNLLLNIGFLKSRFNSINNNGNNILYGLLFNFKFKSFWFSSSYNRIELDNEVGQLSLSIVKSIYRNLLVSISCRVLDDEKKYLISPYISLRYNI
tara:strand:- start:1148 stop:1741 length:594 start_codon:yes stop_codon:yes gene_type:complete